MEGRLYEHHTPTLITQTYYSNTSYKLFGDGDAVNIEVRIKKNTGVTSSWKTFGSNETILKFNY